MPGATGKSIVIADTITRALAQYPQARILILHHREELINQNIEKLRGMMPHAPAGIFSAGLGLKEPHFPIVFGGIKSVANALQGFGWRDLILIDECDLVPPSGEGTYLKVIEHFKIINPAVKVIGYTATPFRIGQGKITEGGKIFTDICIDMTTREWFGWFIANGYLCPPIPQRTKTQIDTSSVSINRGEFNIAELQAASDKMEVTIEACKEAIHYGRERRCWLTFCSGVEHAEHTAEVFNKMGIETQTVTERTPKKLRREYLAAWKNGELLNICNNDCLCLDEQTEILTDKGWTNIDEMSYAHKIAAWNLDGSIEFTEPKFIIKRDRMEHEQMVFAKGYQKDFRVTDKHRMVNKRGHYGSWRVDHAMDIVGKHITMPTNGIASPFRFQYPEPAKDYVSFARKNKRIAALKYKYKTERNLSNDEAYSEAMKTVDSIDSKKYKLPHELTIADCHFIGFWLGDGHLGKQCEISQSKRYAKIIEWFISVLTEMGISYSTYEYQILDRGIKRDIIRWTINSGKGSGIQDVGIGYYIVEPYLNKEGTSLFNGLNREQFEAILFGFWMADGNHGEFGDYTRNKKAGLYICGTQKRLYDCLQAVGVCRGYTIHITKLTPPSNPNHKQEYRISWHDSNTIELLRERAAIETEPFKSERVWCVTSTTSYLITRRNGKVLVTGNTVGIDNPLIDMLVILRATNSTRLFHQIVYRCMRVHESKRNALVLDYAGNTGRLGTIDAPVIPKKKGEGGGDIPIRLCEHCGAYNHISARTCCQCNEPFHFETKFKTHSDNSEILASEQPIVEYFDVTKVIYSQNKTWKLHDSVRVTYHCGLNTHNEILSFGKKGYAGHLAKEWWRRRMPTEPPETVKEALTTINKAVIPKRIKVWCNKKPYPEILAAEF